MKQTIRKIILIIFMILLFTPLTGCTRKKDINQLTLAAMIGVDKDTDSDEIIITVQVVNHLNLTKSPSNTSPIITLSEKGETVFEAFRKVSAGFTSKVFISHIQMLVFGEEAARSGIEKYISFFFLDHEAQHKFNLIIAKDQTAETFLKTYSVFNKVPALDYIQKLETASDISGIGKYTQLSEVLHSLYSESSGMIISSFELKGDPEKGQTDEINDSSEPVVNAWPSDLAVFIKDKLVGYLNYEESIGYNFLTNGITNVVIPVEFDGQKISMEIRNSSSKMKIEVQEGKPRVKFEINTTAAVVADLTGDTNPNKEYADKAKKALENRIKERAEKSIEKAKSLNSDIFSIASTLHKDRPKYFKTIKDSFDDMFIEMEFDVKVNVSIIRIRH